MNKNILDLAEFYGIKVNDDKGCRIIKDGILRPATSKDMESILGLSLDYFSDEIYANWISENVKTNFSVERKNWFMDNTHLTDFKEIPEELKGAA
ncbi:MAG: hypothetical protein KAX49_07700 [Halanaerobiales bacterium]|nr:hypothetical protein [Halanaerobiales bacterium]